MLVLSRKKNESIVVNDTIVITVVEIRGDKVRLGIEGASARRFRYTGVRCMLRLLLKPRVRKFPPSSLVPLPKFEPRQFPSSLGKSVSLIRCL